MPQTDITTLAIEVKNKKAIQSVDQFNTSLNKTSNIAVDSAKAIAGAFASGVIVNFVKQSVKAFSDLEETTSKFNVVFGSVISQAELASKALQTSYGQSELSSKKLLSATGDLLTGFGFTADEALKLSAGIVKVGSDVASFSNAVGGAEAVSSAFTKALFGETESAKTYGVVIRQNSNEFKNLVKSIQLSKNATETQAKALAVYQTILEQSKNAIGDFERTQDSIANQTRILANEFESAQAKIGEVFAPAVQSANSAAIEILKTFNNLSPSTRKLIVLTATFTAGFVAVKTALAAVAVAGAAKNIVTAKSIALNNAETISINKNTASLIKNASAKKLSVVAGTGLVGAGGTGIVSRLAGGLITGVVAAVAGVGDLIQSAFRTPEGGDVYEKTFAIQPIANFISSFFDGTDEAIKKGNEAEAKSRELFQKMTASNKKKIEVERKITEEQLRINQLYFNRQLDSANNQKQLQLLAGEISRIALEALNESDLEKKSKLLQKQFELESRYTTLEEGRVDRLRRIVETADSLTFDLTLEKSFGKNKIDIIKNRINELSASFTNLAGAGKAEEALNKASELQSLYNQLQQAQESQVGSFISGLALMRTTAQTAIEAGSQQARILQSRTTTVSDSLQKEAARDAKTTAKNSEQNNKLMRDLINAVKKLGGADGQAITLELKPLT